jgi:hypothetical protein
VAARAMALALLAATAADAEAAAEAGALGWQPVFQSSESIPSIVLPSLSSRVSNGTASVCDWLRRRLSFCGFGTAAGAAAAGPLLSPGRRPFARGGPFVSASATFESTAYHTHTHAI